MQLFDLVLYLIILNSDISMNRFEINLNDIKEFELRQLIPGSSGESTKIIELSNINGLCRMKIISRKKHPRNGKEPPETVLIDSKIEESKIISLIKVLNFLDITKSQEYIGFPNHINYFDIKLANTVGNKIEEHFSYYVSPEDYSDITYIKGVLLSCYISSEFMIRKENKSNTKALALPKEEEFLIDLQMREKVANIMNNYHKPSRNTSQFVFTMIHKNLISNEEQIISHAIRGNKEKLRIYINGELIKDYSHQSKALDYIDGNKLSFILKDQSKSFPIELLNILSYLEFTEIPNSITNKLEPTETITIFHVFCRKNGKILSHRVKINNIFKMTSNSKKDFVIKLRLIMAYMDQYL